MSAKLKSQRGFVAVTLITILAIALVIIAYATILGTFKGQEVTVVNVQAEIWYSELNETETTANWTSTLPNVANGSVWYSKLNITATGGYTGLVNINWTLHHWSNNSMVSGATITTVDKNLTNTLGQTIYASSTGDITGNTNWGSYTTAAGSYYVKAKIETA